MTKERTLRVLLLEDDPVSRTFLANAVASLPAAVDCADTVAAAEMLAGANTYDVWLFDARLPDGSGDELLTRLRIRHPGVPAIAHTASDDGRLVEGLRLAGFQEVLVKPLPAAAVHAGLRRVLGLEAKLERPLDPSECSELPLWDDDNAAIALGGNPAHVTGLRGLSIGELPAVRQRIAEAAAARDVDGLHAELHRLRASCGFCGAARLGVAVHELQKHPFDPDALTRFNDTALATLGQRGNDATA